MHYEAGLILEGGGMRGVYTAGVLDALLDEKITFSSIYGVSAGACHACSFASGQRGRAFRANVDYLDDPNYCSIQSLLKTGDIFGVDFAYSQIPNVLEPFDHEAYMKYPGRLYAVATNVDTGQAEYLRVRDLKKHMWMVRASASLPLVSRTIGIHGRLYLDGGVSDSIPIRKSQEDGNKKNLVVLTRDMDYRKEANPAMKLIRLRYHGKKAFIQANEDRHIRYNETLDYLNKEEEAGRVFVIRPSEKVEVGRLEKNREKLTALYQRGYDDAKNSMEALISYLES